MSLTHKELMSIRHAQEDFMPNRVIIRRRKYIGDDEFGSEILSKDEPCRISPGWGQWRLVADRFQGVTPFTITFRTTTDIRAGDQIVDENSSTYEVRDARKPSWFLTATQTLADLVTD